MSKEEAFGRGQKKGSAESLGKKKKVRREEQAVCPLFFYFLCCPLLVLSWAIRLYIHIMAIFLSHFVNEFFFLLLIMIMVFSYIYIYFTLFFLFFLHMINVALYLC